MALDRELNMEISRAGDDVDIKLSGVITERSEMNVEEIPAGGRVVIDAGGVENINSMGVRTWLDFIGALCERSREVVIRRLSWVLVWQASMIRSFLGGAQVESFFSPWVCPECDAEHVELHAANDEVPESLPCPKCGNPMELDAERDSFLAFRGG